MARYHGKNGKIVIGTTLTARMDECQDWTLDLDAPMDDASYMGPVSRNVLPGQYGGTVSASCSYDPADSDGQEALVTAFLAGTAVTANLFELPSATTVKYWTVSAYVSKVGEKASNKGRVTRDFTLTIDGDVTRNTVP